MPLKDKVALVTGVSSGIGQAIASTLKSAGAIVYGVSRRREDIPADIHHIPADLTDPSDLEAVFAELSHLDIFINNAGVAYTSRIIDGDPAQWEEMWRINVHALALCCQQAVPLMAANGSIINISSQSGHRVPPSGGFYSPTKFAVRGITDALRHELSDDNRKIRVGSISPGFVDTPILDSYFAGREEQLAKTKASVKMLAPQDIADTVLHMVTAPAHIAFDDIRIRSVEQKG